MAAADLGEGLPRQSFSFQDTGPTRSKIDEEALQQAALESLSGRDRMRLATVPKDERFQDYLQQSSKLGQIDVSHLTPDEHRAIVDKALQTTDQDNEKFLRKLRERIDRVGIQLPTVEVRYEDLNVSAKVYVGSRALPSLTNSALNLVQLPLQRLGLLKSNKRDFPILRDVNGRLKPGRMTLLLGPPGSGKTTLLLTLAGKAASDLIVTGKITYNGVDIHDFVPQRVSAYISQSDVHTGELTVRETFDFATRVQGPGYKAEMIDELTKREQSQRIAPDPDIDAFVKASTLPDKQRNVGTEYILRVLGLDYAADTVIGNEMMRGISGGQKKRVTTGEMIVGPKKALFMDEISTGLDSSTTFQIVKAVRNWTHLMEGTVLMALLQPAPEAFELFDDVLLLSEGYVVFHGPVAEVLSFFESLGFTPPERKGIADFLQEVTSKKDQAQYWNRREPYRYVPVSAFAAAFKQSRWGREIQEDLSQPVQPAKPLALPKEKYALNRWAMFRALLRRELILMKRNRFLYTFRTVQCGIVAFITATLFFRTTLGVNLQDGPIYLGVLFFSLIHMLFNGFSELAITVGRLPVFYRQRDNLFYTGWALNLPTAVLRIPYSFAEATIWTVIVYYVVGLAPQADRFFTYWFLMVLVHSMALALFRLIAALGRKMVIANTGGSFALLVIFLLGGFILSKPDIKPWWVWGYWISPLAYAQNAIAVNEFTAPRWQRPNPQNPTETLGFAILRQRGLHTAKWWIWVGFATLIGFYFLFNILVSLALQYLPSLDSVQAIVPEDTLKEKHEIQHGTGSAKNQAPAGSITDEDGDVEAGTADCGKAKAPSVPPISEADGAEGDVEMGRIEHHPSAAAPPIEEVNGNGIVPVGGRSNGEREIAPSRSGLGAPTRSLRQRFSMTPSKRGSGLKQRSSLERVADKGMILPFQPLAMTFHHVNYAVDMPKEFQKEGQDKKLWLLNDISGTFRPGVLTALMGVSGAGKTTLMDVLAGRKTGGYIEGEIRVGGHPKVQETFARISGYVEQNDIHSPQLTVLESLRFSAWLRLAEDIDKETRNEFVDEVMELVELTAIRNALVGLPGSSGLSVEQRKRLTIAVELVANPSIIFMDEPTSGLDARAAAIVMRTVRNTVNTGRTVVCTIHQPSIDIFESFDELLLLKRGGRTIYAGPLGKDSSELVKYFKHVPGVPDIPPRYNPAAWMLDSTTPGMEEKLHVDFADIFKQSDLYKQLERTIEEESKPAPGVEPLRFEKKYPQNPLVQTVALLWKNNITYWRTPEYNFVRFLFCTVVGVIFGSIYWNLGTKRGNLGQVLNVAGGLYAVVLFLGVNNASTVQPVVAVERGVSYRERAAGMYSAIPYAIAQGLIEFPYVMAQTIVYSAITYSMIHFQWTAAKFFWYTLFMFLTLMIFTFYGMMAVAITPNVQLAAVISSAFYSIFNLFAGFLLPQPRIPGWWVWAWYLDPVAWSLYGLVGSQLGDIDTEFITNQSGQIVSVADFIRQYFGYRYSFLGWVVFIMCAFVIAFWGIVIFAIKRFNFQKR